MATYEVLEPGGHARLVSDIKGYANRASGVGTTQIADESVTSAKLADDVTDTLDHVESFTDPMNKNGLHGELAEGLILTADDVYPMPARDVEVYGKSEQVTTTGKNLIPTALPDNAIHATINGANEYSTATLASAGNAWVFAIPCERNTTYFFSSNANGAISCLGLSDRLPVVGDTCVRIIGMTNYTQRAISTGENDYILIQVANTAHFDAIPSCEGMIEKGSTATTYEPYSGGKPAPSPDFPQSIESVDDLTMVFAGRNLLNPTLYSNVSYGSTTYYTTNSDGSITVHNSDGRGNAYVTNTFTLRAGTYTVSRTRAIGNWGVTRKSDGVTIAGGSAAGAVSSLTFTLDVETEIYIKLSYSAASGSYPFTTFVQLEAGDTATTYTPYVAPTTVQVPLSNNSVRSLPDGTRDTLMLTYIGPSEREGWGVYDVELVQRVGHIADMGELAWNTYTYSDTLFMYANIADMVTAQIGITTILCSGYTAQVCKTVGELVVMPDLNCASRSTYKTVYVKDSNYTDASAFKTAVAGMTLDYPLATPVTHDLGTVELPVNPSPNLTAWADGGSAQPTMSMTYERDVNIVISNMMSVIADAATS